MFEDMENLLLGAIDNSTSNTEGTQQNERETQPAMNEATTESKLSYKYEFYSLGEFLAEITPMEYLIDNWIQDEGLHEIFGESGSYKTFAVIGMCASIACKDIDTWCGKKVEHGDVVYLCGEGAKGLKKRYAAWCLENGRNPRDIPLYISPEAFALDDTTPEYCIENTIANIHTVCKNPKLVVIDTLNRYMAGEENSNTDMGTFVRACSTLSRKLGCAVLIVHHTGLSQDAKNRGRGAGALHNALDIEIKCTKSGMTCTLEQTKNKENAKDKPISFNMEEIAIPNVKDKKGNLVRTTSLVAVFNEEGTKELATAKPEETGKKISKPVRFARETYSEAAKQYGKIVVDDAETGHETVEVSIKDWRKVFYEQSSAETNDAKRTAFGTARKALLQTKETRILTKRTKEGIEYYCLDLSGDTELSYRAEIRVGIKAREKAEAEAQPEERTGNLFEETPR